MSQKNFALVEDTHRHGSRVSWTSANGVMYCGICLRGEIRAKAGNTCSHCGSKVRQVFEVITGGAPKSYAARRREVTNTVPYAEPLLKVQAR